MEMLAYVTTRNPEIIWQIQWL